jgi:hypothetical protein
MSTGKFKELKLLLKSLPTNLPIQVANQESRLNRLLNFTLDEETVEDIVGEEGAVNRELEAALFDFLPRNDAGIFFIKERGPALEALADILEIWVTKLPGSMILQLWLKSSIDSAKKCIVNHQGQVSFGSRSLVFNIDVLKMCQAPRLEFRETSSHILNIWKGFRKGKDWQYSPNKIICARCYL